MIFHPHPANPWEIKSPVGKALWNLHVYTRCEGPSFWIILVTTAPTRPRRRIVEDQGVWHIWGVSTADTSETTTWRCAVPYLTWLIHIMIWFNGMASNLQNKDFYPQNTGLCLGSVFQDEFKENKNKKLNRYIIYRNINWANSYYLWECVSTFETCWGTPCLKDRRSQFWALSILFVFVPVQFYLPVFTLYQLGWPAHFCLSLRQKNGVPSDVSIFGSW